MKRIIYATLISLVVPLGFWFGGFDFNERGFVAAYCFMWTLFLFLAVYLYPGWSK